MSEHNQENPKRRQDELIKLIRANRQNVPAMIELAQMSSNELAIQILADVLKIAPDNTDAIKLLEEKRRSMLPQEASPVATIAPLEAKILEEPQPSSSQEVPTDDMENFSDFEEFDFEDDLELPPDPSAPTVSFSTSIQTTLTSLVDKSAPIAKQGLKVAKKGAIQAAHQVNEFRQSEAVQTASANGMHFIKKAAQFIQERFIKAWHDLKRSDQSWSLKARNPLILASLALVAAAIILLVQSRPRPKTIMPATKMVAGAVVDAFRRVPISGAIITFTGTNNANSRKAVTRDDGTYFFTDINSDVYKVEVWAVNYIEKEQTEINVNVEDQQADINFMLEPAAVIQGSVQSADGTPLDEVMVTVRSEDAYLTSTLTQPDGTFSVKDIATLPNYTLTANKEGYIFPIQLLRAGSSLTLTAVNFQAFSGTLQGQVIDLSSNQPIANALVYLMPVDQAVVNSLEIPFFLTQTAEDGRYQVTNLPVTAYELKVIVEGYEIHKVDRMDFSGSQTLDFQLEKTQG